MADDQHAFCVHHEGLLPAEFLQRSGYFINGMRGKFARVSGVRNGFIDWPLLDEHFVGTGNIDHGIIIVRKATERQINSYLGVNLLLFYFFIHIFQKVFRPFAPVHFRQRRT